MTNMTREQYNELIEVFFFTQENIGNTGAIEAVANAAVMYIMGEIGDGQPITGPLYALELVSRAMGKSRIELRDNHKWKPLNEQRWIAMWLLRQTGTSWRRLSYPEIAKALGLRSHTSVLHGVRKVEDSPALLGQAREILERASGQGKSSASLSP